MYLCCHPSVLSCNATEWKMMIYFELKMPWKPRTMAIIVWLSIYITQNANSMVKAIFSMHFRPVVLFQSTDCNSSHLNLNARHWLFLFHGQLNIATHWLARVKHVQWIFRKNHFAMQWHDVIWSSNKMISFTAQIYIKTMKTGKMLGNFRQMSSFQFSWFNFL